MSRHLVGLLIVLGLSAPAVAADKWHLPDWQARAIVEISKPLPDVDTAAAKILCQGQAKPDGSDYRVLDADGKPLPFQLTYHDAAHYSLVAFKAAAPKPGQKFFIYFNNPKAEKAPEEIVVDPTPGAGPPKGAWIPRYGLVLQTLARQEKTDNPKTPEEMARLIADSPFKEGARYQRRISDGYNPFGSSDYYISIYRGWMQIPKAGKYSFCTASNEASFSFLDGKTLVHWPGQHTAERGIHGEKNATVELTAGLHYVEYYHEEVTLEQMAFLGWKPDGQPGFGAIPESIYTAPHETTVTAYETPKGPTVRFEPAVLDSVWPTARHEGQYTRFGFQVSKPLPEGMTFHWDFGDGQAADGATAEHLYLSLGNYNVTLTAKDAAGSQTAHWPLNVYEIEHVTDQFKEGKPKEYAKLARSYDRTKLDAANLLELANLFTENEEPQDGVAVGQEFLKRFADERPSMVARARRLLAECALRLGKEGIDTAVANFQDSFTEDTPPAEKLDILAKLILLLGRERGLTDRADTIFKRAEKTYKSAPSTEETQAAFRRVVIALGDAQLWSGKIDAAREDYARAETLNINDIPLQVRLERVGSNPNAIREFIEMGNNGAALDVVDRWEETFPTEKVKGHTFFWRGKLLYMRDQPRDAARHLELALRLCSGAPFESEARWLRALALEKSGHADEARKELARIVKSGVDDEFRKKALDKLQQK